MPACRLTPVLAWQQPHAIPLEELCRAGYSVVLAIEVLSVSLHGCEHL